MQKKTTHASKPTRKPRVPKEAQSNATGLVIPIGRRDFDYDKVRTATLHAPLIEVPLSHLSIFKDIMASDQLDMATNPVDDGIIRIVRVRPDFYEIISGKNKIIAAIADYKRAIRKAGEEPANQGKTLEQLGIKVPSTNARLASWKHLNPCEHFGKKLDGDELKASLQQLSEGAGIAVKLPRDRNYPVNTAALFQPPKKEPKIVAPSSGRFGRIFSGSQAAA